MTKVRIFPALLILLVFGCSSLPLKKARTAFYAGNLGEADRVLENCSAVAKKDRLLCYMEKGLILYYSQKYEASTEVLLSASRLIEEQDRISIKDQSAAVLVNDNVTAYKGEYSERLWVHTFLMMNFLLQYKYESALVEAKQALEVFDAHPDPLAGDHYSRALIALCYENMNLVDDARIEYEKLALAMGDKDVRPQPLPSGKGELMLFVAQGRIPVKTSTNVVLPPSIRISVPRYVEGAPAPPVSIRSDGQRPKVMSVSTDLGRVARQSLDDRAAQYLSRQALRVGAKEAIAQGVGENNELAEVAVRIVLFLLEEADVRSWQTLPGHLTLVRIALDAGVHNLEVSAGYADAVHLKGVEIRPGSRVYRSFRL